MDLKTGGPAHHDITRASSEQAQQGVTQIIELGILHILVLRQTFFVNFTPPPPPSGNSWKSPLIMSAYTETLLHRPVY